MTKSKDEYIEMYKMQINESKERIEKIEAQRVKDISEDKIPNYLLDSEKAKLKKVINYNIQLLNAMGIEFNDL